MDDGFERFSRIRWVFKRVLTDPIANYLPAALLRGLLRFGKSELANANWTDPGGWRSMVISYDGKPRQFADRILVSGGAVSMALRNRLRLASRLLAELIDQAAAASDPSQAIHVLCLGAGPGQVVVRAMELAASPSRATLVDINPDAFAFGRELATRRGLLERVSFICGDCRDIKAYLTEPPAIVKMLGICEYLTDRQIADIASCAAAVMPPGSPILFNNITPRHGNDRFLRRVFGLHMTYRSTEQLGALMRTAGFDNFVVHDEPLGVYSVIVGRRVGAAVATGSPTTATIPAAARGIAAIPAAAGQTATLIPSVGGATTSMTSSASDATLPGAAPATPAPKAVDHG